MYTNNLPQVISFPSNENVAVGEPTIIKLVSNVILLNAPKNCVFSNKVSSSVKLS